MSGVIIAVLLSAITAITWLNARRVWGDAQEVEHTQRVLDALEVMLSTAKDAETGQRGYLLTGEEPYLAPLESAVAALDGQVDAIAQLTADNPRQQARMPEVRALLAAKRGEIDAAIAAYRSNGLEAALELVRSDRGKRLMDQLRALVATMKADEEALMVERRARSEQSYRVAVGSAVASGSIGLVLVAVLVVGSARNLRQRARAADALFEQRELLQTTLASIGDAVITTDVAGRVTFLNAVASELTGLTQKQAAGQALDDVFRIVNETTRLPVENPVTRALREGRIVGLANHTILLARDGAERPIDDSAAPIRDAAGNVSGAVLVFRDVAAERRADAEMRLSEARKSAILSTALDCIITVDQDGRILEFNPACERTFGHLRDVVLGKDVVDLLVPAVRRDQSRALLARYLESGDGPALNRRIEATALRADGSEIAVELAISAIPDGKRQVFTAYLRDVTERRRAEAALVERMRLLELVADVGDALVRRDTLRDTLQQCAEVVVRRLDAALARIWTLDAAGATLRLEASAGLSREISGPYATLAVGEREIGAIAQAAAPFATNQVVGDDRLPEQEWARAEGLRSFAGWPLVVEGRVIGVMALYARRELSDTTLGAFAAAARQVAVGIQRKRAEEEVGRLLARERVRAERLSTLAGASASINSAMTGQSVAGVVCAEARRILSADAAEIVTAEVGTVPAAALCAPLVGRGGRAWGTLCLTRDGASFDDEDRAVLAQLVHLATVAFDNARLYEELRDGDRRKDEFLATLAHELRNPLAPIRNALRIMRLAHGDASATEQGRAMIERQMDQIVRLVDDLIDVSRISRGKLQLRRERLQLATVLEAALETSRPLIEEAGHALEVTIPEEPLWLDGDATRLAQVFLNLLNNAAKYTRDRGHIWLEAERAGDVAVVRVRDSGIGIPARMLPRVFDMFTQVEERTLQRTEGGLGIGLTLVKELVEMHGGTVVAHSDGPGTGSSFEVRLPLAAPRASEPAREGPREQQPAGGGRARRVLVVDDNRDAVESLAILLEMMGYEVRTAGDGLEAVTETQAFSPDVVLLDIGLPVLNGYEAAERIRALDGGGAVVLVALTGWGQEEDRRRSREAGFDHHLVKPVDPDALEALLRRVVPGGGSGQLAT